MTGRVRLDGRRAAPARGSWPPCRAGAAALLLLAAGAAFAGAPSPAGDCALRLSEHRSGRELGRVPLAVPPTVAIAFEHSVLGTTVLDRYEFRPAAWLVEERFDGEGYGLPHVAGEGETLERDGAQWRLRLERRVDPLVVRALPAQRMRLVVGDAELPLAPLSRQAIRLQLVGCGA